MKEKSLRYEDFVLKVITAIEAVGVADMIGGAVTAWAWGEPRAFWDYIARAGKSSGGG
jgi:hypothetical protein